MTFSIGTISGISCKKINGQSRSFSYKDRPLFQRITTCSPRSYSHEEGNQFTPLADMHTIQKSDDEYFFENQHRETGKDKSLTARSTTLTGTCL